MASMSAVCSTSAMASARIAPRPAAARSAAAALTSAPLRLRSRRARFAATAIVTPEVASLDVGKMEPLGDRILVRPREADAKSAGGVLLSSSAGSMQDALVGTVVAVGEEVDLGVAAGDSVLYSKYGSSDIEGPDGTVSFVAQKSVMAKLS